MFKVSLTCRFTVVALAAVAKSSAARSAGANKPLVL